MVLVKMLMEIDPPPDERIVGDDNGDDFPLPERKFPQQNSSTGALDWFCQGSALWWLSFVP